MYILGMQAEEHKREKRGKGGTVTPAVKFGLKTQVVV